MRILKDLCQVKIVSLQAAKILVTKIEKVHRKHKLKVIRQLMNQGLILTKLKSNLFLLVLLTTVTQVMLRHQARRIRSTQLFNWSGIRVKVISSVYNNSYFNLIDI